MTTLQDMTIGVLGGTGPQGRGLAVRFARAGLRVLLGSRDPDRAVEAATGLGHGIRGAGNAEVATSADLVVVAVPYAGHSDLLDDLREPLADKIVVDCVNPLGFDKQGAYAIRPEAGSAAEEAAVILVDSTVVGAFHNVSAVLLEDPEAGSVDTDVLVLGDVREATDLVAELAETIPGVRGIYGGRLRNAFQVEALTANLISINRRYRAHAGVRMTDV